MGIPCPILNAGYTQWVVSLYTQHDAACPPIPPSPAPLPGLLEGPWPMGNPAGTLSHKTAMNVLVDGNPGVKQGHDVGYMIPHFAVPMNALCAVNTLLSKHKVMIPVSSVQMKGSPAGTYLPFLFGEICCNPVSLPTGVVLLFKCTVWTSPSLIDIIKGLLYIALDILFDKIWKRFIKGPLENLTAKLSWKILQRFRGPVCTLLLCAFLRSPRLMNSRGLQVIAQHLLPKLNNKVVDHLTKTWVISPLVTGGARGAPSVGRGDYSVKFFNHKPWW